MGDTMNFSELTNVTTKDHYNAVISIQVVSIVLTSITCVLGIPSNAVVIWIAGVKMKTTVNTVWYVNLAVTDLLCCLVIPFIISAWLLGGHWPYGAAMCRVIPTVIYLTMYASMFLLILISLDRYAMVVWPVWAQNHRSIYRARLLCGLTWLLALFLTLPSLIYRKIQVGNNNKITCRILNKSVFNVNYGIRVGFGFLVPLLVITVCYLLIARKVSVRRFKSQKTLSIMVVVVTVFFVCWMPVHTVSLVNEYWSESEKLRAVYPLVFSLAYFNSCLNPVLYVFMGRDFKERVRLSLHRIFENAFIEDFAMS